MAGAPGTPIRLRRDTETEWETDNPVLGLGETGWTTDTRRVKLGDGVTPWNDLLFTDHGKADQTELSYEQANSDAVYVGGSFTGVASTPVAVDGPYVIVPPSDRPQSVIYKVSWNITVAGNGTFTLQLYEWTGGTATLRSYMQEWVSASRPTTSMGNRPTGEHRVDPHDDWKVFQVYFTLTRDPGSSLQMNVPMLGTDYSKAVCRVVKQ